MACCPAAQGQCAAGRACTPRSSGRAAHLTPPSPGNRTSAYNGELSFSLHHVARPPPSTRRLMRAPNAALEGADIILEVAPAPYSQHGFCCAVRATRCRSCSPRRGGRAQAACGHALFLSGVIDPSRGVPTAYAVRLSETAGWTDSRTGQVCRLLSASSTPRRAPSRPSSSPRPSPPRRRPAPTAPRAAAAGADAARAARGARAPLVPQDPRGVLHSRGGGSPRGRAPPRVAARRGPRALPVLRALARAPGRRGRVLAARRRRRSRRRRVRVPRRLAARSHHHGHPPSLLAPLGRRDDHGRRRELRRDRRRLHPPRRGPVPPFPPLVLSGHAASLTPY